MANEEQAEMAEAVVARLSVGAKQVLLQVEQVQMVGEGVWCPDVSMQRQAVREAMLGGFLRAAWMDDGQQITLGYRLTAYGEDFACFLRDPAELQRRFDAIRRDALRAHADRC